LTETGITKDDIAGSYTDLGGLHGLNYNDYGNYYDYQQEKQKLEIGQFFTPYNLADWIINCLKPKKSDLTADLCCGHGAFINSTPNELNFYGCEIDKSAFKVAKYLYSEAKISCDDIRNYNPGTTFDYVVGNPPYNLCWRKDGESYSSEFYYCLRAAELLKPCGVLAIIVPESFASDEFSNKAQIEKLNEKFNFVAQIKLDENSFKDLGVENYSTKLLILQKKSKHTENVPFKTEILINISNSEEVFQNYLKPLIKAKEELKQKLLLENLNTEQCEEKWSFKVKKLLYDIKCHPKTEKYLAECQEYINKYFSQKQPEYMDYAEWQKVKIKPDDVIKKLKKTLNLQHPQKNKKNRLIKNRHTLKFNDVSVPIYKAVTKNYYPFEDKTYLKLIDKKINQYELQSKDFSKMEQNSHIENWLKNFQLKVGFETIKLNKMQLHDTNLFLQKPYAFVQWEQGSGKTITGIAQAEYRLQQSSIRNVFVVSTAIAIKNNRNEVLENYGINFLHIEKLSDISKIEKGQYVTITLNLLCKYQNQLKKFMKKQSQKVMLIFDESDNMSNPNTSRTKAVLNVFRKLKYKLLMTGTSTRNNISEIVPQLELLYNNSFNMISECDYIYKREKTNANNKLENGLVQTFNDYQNMPIPAYKKGYKLFTQSHIPEKITVLGIKQYTQDIYNSHELKRLINKTIITRTFSEVTGKQLHKIEQISCAMNNSEKALYSQAIEKFYELEYLFTKTGNDRKDAMLKILHQLLLLLKLCAAPQTIKEYNSDLLPDKFKKVLSLLEKYNDERIAIGVRSIGVTNNYYSEIKKAFPNRPIFLITGGLCLKIVETSYFPPPPKAGGKILSTNLGHNQVPRWSKEGPLFKNSEKPQTEFC
jgi:hypothetical protein